jgi:hypothetical protein
MYKMLKYWRKNKCYFEVELGAPIFGYLHTLYGEEALLSMNYYGCGKLSSFHK